MVIKFPPSASAGLSLLARADIRVRLDDERHVFLARPDDPVWIRARIKVSNQSPSAWDVERDLRSAGADSLLYVVSGASAYLNAMADSNSQIVVADVGENRVTFQGGTTFTTGRDNGDEKVRKPRGRVPWSRYAVVRCLILSTAAQTQVQIAERAGVTQAAVSQVLKYLGDEIERVDTGWRAKSVGSMFDLFMAEYPGPGGLSSYWLSLSSPRAQAIEAESQAESQIGSSSHLISGDVAVDEYFPWRRPARALVYVRTGLEMKKFAEVDPADASLELRVPADQTIWSTSHAWRSGNMASSPHDCVDPIIATWDSLQTGGSDVEQAVQQVRAELIARAERGRP